MEQCTPKGKKFSLSCKFKNKNNEYGEPSVKKPANDIQKTPTQRRLSLSQADDCSPVFIPQTQEALEQLDVIWDWNSPESNKRQKRPIQKKVQAHQPSNKPIRRHASNNHIESYDKLKHELETLKNQLVESRSTDKCVGKTLFPPENETDKEELKDLDVLFGDDSLDEEMILQSQKIEELLTVEIESNGCDIINVQNTISDITTSTSSRIELRKVKSDNSISNTLKNDGSKKEFDSLFPSVKIDNAHCYKSNKYNIEPNMAVFSTKDDSFDCLIKSFNETKTLKESTCTEGTVMEKTSTDQKELNNYKLCNKQEIEQKKLEAMAKLQAKRQVTSAPLVSKQATKSNEDKPNRKDEVSPIKCSPEEIEQKRLQALAKLEAKKKQEKIERNRREALKRLEMNKQKRAMTFKNLYKK